VIALKRPNAYFADLGLISLALAHSEATQSRKRPPQLEGRTREIRPSCLEEGAGFKPSSLSLSTETVRAPRTVKIVGLDEDLGLIPALVIAQKLVIVS
jgi:hypothetical protein